MNMKKNTLILFSMLVVLLAGCGKYDNGPFLSLRSKNARLSGEWKVVKYDYNWTDPADASQNVSSVLNGGNMTATSQVPIYDPFDGSIIGYNAEIATYPYSETWEIETKDNSIKTSVISNGSADVTTSLWSWSDGIDEQEILEIDGQGYIIKRLTNKEMELYLEYKEDGATGSISMTFEKQ